MRDYKTMVHVVMMEPKWLRLSEIRARYGVGKTQLRSWCARNWVKTCKITSRNVLYRCEDVERVLEDLAEHRRPEKFRGTGDSAADIQESMKTK